MAKLFTALFALIASAALAEDDPLTMSELREIASEVNIDDREATQKILIEAVRLKSPMQAQNVRGRDFLAAHIVEDGMVGIDEADIPWADAEELSAYVEALNLHISNTVGYIQTANDLLEALETCDCPRIVIPSPRRYQFFEDVGPGDEEPPSITPSGALPESPKAEGEAWMASSWRPAATVEGIPSPQADARATMDNTIAAGPCIRHCCSKTRCSGPYGFGARRSGPAPSTTRLRSGAS